MNDLVNKPAHYKGFEIEPIDIIRHAPFCLGNCLKYIIRAEYKGTPELDYQKADKYLTWCYEDYDSNTYKAYETFIEYYGLILKKHELFTFIELGCYTGFLNSIQGFLIQKLGKTEEYHKRNNYED